MGWSIRRFALAASVTVLASGWISSVSDAATTSRAIELLGNGIESVHFGTGQSSALSRLHDLFGRWKTTMTKADGNCGVTAESVALNVQLFFERAKFVGYEIGSANAKIVSTPSVETTKGLRLGDTITQAEKIYGSSFSTSSAQGGSWTAKTSLGRLIGLLVGPPGPVGLSDKVELIAAGYMGCPAMTP